MEKKQNFFTSLKQEVIRTLSPSRSRSGSPMSGLLRRKKGGGGGGGLASLPDQVVAWRSGSLRPVGRRWRRMEGPDPDGGEAGDPRRSNNGSGRLGQWVKGQLHRAPSVSAAACRRSDLRVLLGVLGAPLAPVHVSSLDPLPLLSIKDTPIETSSAQYILQQYTAASGGQTLQNSVKNAYAMGKVRMTTSEFETVSKVIKNRNSAHTGGFVLWQMDPDMWYVELAVGGSKVHAGCNGKLVWRHTPWLGAHTAKGPVRPLRRALQGLDPRTTVSLFADARCVGEKKLNGEDCFILKLCADPQTLKARSEGPAEIIRHVLFGYFSQKTGLLVYLEDSHLTRIQCGGGDAVYWETTINSYLHDYRPVEGIMIAHSGHSVVTLFRFGETAMSHTKTRMEESWTIEEVAFNVPGLSEDCFIPPADLRSGSICDISGLHQDERGKSALALSAYRAKVAALEQADDSCTDNVIWRMEV
ncbi:LOW QUALITY PROTEIN: uncharacterized protein LOC104418679 [Eucalyptus grandis]|uniref:LOW QUALITY PROTEIN: uncharacterized protein LOC104418679 n=1 Tax=Eucalyptus grandis TaxID=71139 RepID=UPI00192EE4D1|nr:LOW QUALITY PROTEIN: uncharacterized protein LOC104418679 [Eucalyptus grandis]